jgi:M6 family metalloprotease-like protein
MESQKLILSTFIFGLLFLAPTHATIVYQNQVVSAWPPEALPDAPVNNKLKSTKSPAYSLAKTTASTSGMGYYPQPKGHVLGLTLLVDFSDEPAHFTIDEVREWLNQPGFNRDNCNGSVRDYFLSVSNGYVDFQNEVFGYYRAIHPKSYYDGGSGYERSSILRQEVLDYFDPMVDFSKYDNDNDGYTDAISIAYAGAGAVWGQGIWPHSGWIGQNRDNVTINRYMMTDIQYSFSLYVFAHETAHMLFGWPDLYWFGDYCLLGNRMSDNNPTPVNDFFRADQGWIPLISLDSEINQTFVVGGNDTAYRFVNQADTMEGFIWSYTKNQDRYSSLDGAGLLMYHYNMNVSGNTASNSLQLRVVQASGSTSLQDEQWPWPGSHAADFFDSPDYPVFSHATHNLAFWDDGAPSELVLRNILENRDSLFFTIGSEEPTQIPRIRPSLASIRTPVYFTNPLGQITPVSQRNENPQAFVPRYPVYSK